MAMKKSFTTVLMKAIHRFPASDVAEVGGGSCHSLINRLPRAIAAWTVGVVLATMSLGGVVLAQTPTALLSVAAQNTDGLVSENGGTATFEVALTGTVASPSTAITVVCSIDFDRMHSEASDKVDPDEGDDDEDSTNDHKRWVTITPSTSTTGTCAFDLINDDTHIEPDKFLEVVLEEDSTSLFPSDVGIDDSNNRATVTVTSNERGTIRSFQTDFPVFERMAEYNGYYAALSTPIHFHRADSSVTGSTGYLAIRATISGEVSNSDFVGLTNLTAILAGFPSYMFNDLNPTAEAEPFVVPVADDDEVEGGEAGTVTLSFVDPRWARSVTLDPAVFHFQIVDNDGTDKVLFMHRLDDDATIAEGQTTSVFLMVSPQLETAAMIPMSVELVGASTGDWSASNLDSSGGEYSATVPAGEDGVEIQITATEDGVWDRGEAQTVTIGIDADNLPAGFAAATGDGAHPQSLTVTLEDGAPPRLQLALAGSGTGAFQEGNAAYQESFTITIPNSRQAFAEDRMVTLALGSNSEASLDDIVLDSSATTAVLLPAGARSVTAAWTFSIADDDVVEGPERLSIQPTIDGPGADLVEFPGFTFTNPLQDNDTATVGFSTAVSTAPVAEGAMVTLTVTLSKPVTEDVTVPWNLAGVDAADLGLNSLTTTPIRFTAGGSLTQDIVLTIADDSDAEIAETVIVTLGDPTSDLGSLISLDSDNAVREVVIELNDGATERRVTDVAVTSPAPTFGYPYGIDAPGTFSFGAPGYYVYQESITIAVTFDGEVTVTGTPTIGLRIGNQVRRAAYTGDADSAITELTFTYVVQVPDEDHDGVSVVANSLSASGADSISGVGEGVFAILRHPGTPDLDGHAVDVQDPTIATIDIQSRPLQGNTYGVCETISARVVFSEPVWVFGGLTLDLQIGEQTVVVPMHTDEFPTAEVMFRYELTTGDSDASGVSIPENPVTPQSGTTIRDVVNRHVQLGQFRRRAGPDLDAHRVDGTAVAAALADVTGDDRVQYHDAIILHHTLQFADLLEIDADPPSPSAVAYRQTFIAPYVPGGQRESVDVVLQSASAVVEAGDARSCMLDVTGDGELDGTDAAILYYALRFPELADRGRRGVPAGFTTIRDSMVRTHLPFLDRASIRAMLARADAFRDR